MSGAGYPIYRSKFPHSNAVIRVAEDGEEGQSVYAMDVGVYSAGADGWFEHGFGDDERIAEVDWSELKVTSGPFEPTYEDWVSPPEYPSDHTPDGSPPTLSAKGVFIAGSDSGSFPYRIEHPTYGAIEADAQIVPPDWCPNGIHDGGWGPGYCE